MAQQGGPALTLTLTLTLTKAHEHVAAVFDGGAPIGLRLAAARRPATAVGDVGDDQVEVAQVLLVAGVGAV